MASSTKKQQLFPTSYGSTAAPPPTPSTQPNLISTSDAADGLSRLLHRLPPTLSMPTRRTSPTTTSPPLISLSNLKPSLITNFHSVSQLGFFQLINHSIPSQLVHSAESDSLSLFNLPPDQKQSHFPKNWPIGFDADDEEDDNGAGESFCFDSSCSTELSDFPLTSLREFTREMEGVGLAVIEALSCAVGFSNPVQEDPTRVCSLMWVSEGSVSQPGNNIVGSGKLYPYVVGLHYQIRSQKSSVLADSGWVSILPQVDSILITLGDIAQVWSNGKLKKVRGRPVPCLGGGNNSPVPISMSLLLTLPLESNVSSLLPVMITGGSGNDHDNNEDEDDAMNMREESMYNSFSFEDYAWRVYHERLILKDPLNRYRA